RPGAGSVFALVAVAALLTNHHSANRSRFLHSWLAVAWVAAGAGAALAAQQVAARVRSWRGAGTAPPALRLLAPGPLAAGLARRAGPALVGLGHAEEGGPQGGRPNLLGVADAVVPELARAEHPALASDAPFDLLLNWRLGEDRGALRRLLIPPRDLLATVPREGLGAWLEQNSCDALLLIDAPFSAVLPADPALRVDRLREYLASSGNFTLGSEWHSAGEVRIPTQVWRRTSAAAGPALASQGWGPQPQR